MDFLISHNTHQVIKVFVSKHLHIEAKAAKKPLLNQTEHWELNSFTNMVAKIDIDALKI